MKVTNLWSAGWMEKIPGGEHLSIRRCPAARAQASLILTIPNYLLSRQVKILDSTLLSVILTVVMAHHIFVMRVPDRQKLLEQLHQQIIVDGPRPKHSQNSPIFDSYKIPEFFKKSPLS